MTPRPHTDRDDVPPVRYYPRRIRRPAPPTPLSPSQALHLADDPSRAERARRTAQHRWVQSPPEAVPAAQGRVRRFLHRLLRSSSRRR